MEDPEDPKSLVLALVVLLPRVEGETEGGDEGGGGGGGGRGNEGAVALAWAAKEPIMLLMAFSRRRARPGPTIMAGEAVVGVDEVRQEEKESW